MGTPVVGPMTRLHVVHVLHSLAVGGTENGVVNLIQALDGEVRHSVVSMTGSGPLAARLPSHVELSCLGKRPGLDVWAVARMTRLFRRLRPDVVHSRNWGTFDAILAARLARVPVVIHGEHGREADDPDGRSRRRNRLRRLAAPFVDRFVAVSQDLHRWLIQVVGIPEGRVMTIHNGVDEHRFRDDDRETGRRALGMPADAVVVGAVGRLDPVKDQLGLLDCLLDFHIHNYMVHRILLFKSILLLAGSTASVRPGRLFSSRRLPGFSRQTLATHWPPTDTRS